MSRSTGMRPAARARRRAVAGLSTTAAALAAGLALAATAAAIPVPDDPLTGSGAVARTLLTRADLTSGASTAPVSDGAFALPAAAAPPRHDFEGTLTLENTATGGGFKEIVDTDSRTSRADSPWKHLPPFSVTLVQNGSHLIPTKRGLTYTGSPTYNLVVSPGRVWSESGDGGMTRAALPFALVERNANCVHNGVLTFLFDDATTTQARYQVTQETCRYQKNDMWGQLPVTVRRFAVPGAAAIEDAYATEVGDRLPTKPIAALATDHPSAGLDLSRFGGGISAAHMSAYGVVVNGVNYTGGCGTRYGTYAFCDQLLLPSYSTAKSAFAGTAFMRLAQLYGGSVANESIGRWVPETAGAAGTWSDVTLDNALDMATGNYALAGYESDENSLKMTAFLTAESYADKMAKALVFPRKATPGTKWIYHTSDTFLATRAQNAILRSHQGSGAEIFAMLRDDVFKPLKLAPETWESERTDNSPTGAAWGGYGLVWTTDAIAKVAKLHNNDGGRIAGAQVLSPTALAASMQRDPADRGLTTSGPTPFKYNNGFWALQFTPAAYPQYRCSFYVPFMSGYGGITVAMAPNGATYYYFSDNNEFAWAGAVNETAKIAPMC
ncbi:hypothetical protein [Conexibacter arvalis]|uniref:Beta-lactamase-related domain-containing protein n=1 Tax=Conexibacter arvalis TaxID=912552 RepID=A0A840IAU9_9ACTN|nr:hypothetical protein [Conexibacter arvalis]MBB4661381.1 hypothetical protein [Conexibacter arvalis]